MLDPAFLFTLILSPVILLLFFFIDINVKEKFAIKLISFLVVFLIIYMTAKFTGIEYKTDFLKGGTNVAQH